MENALAGEMVRHGREWQLFIKEQEKIINQRLARYLNPKTVLEDSLELKGEITPYQRYKSTSVAPQLKNALEMIRNGKYGICKDCEKEIPIGRLRLVPGANRCLSCQIAHDKK